MSNSIVTALAGITSSLVLLTSFLPVAANTQGLTNLQNRRQRASQVPTKGPTTETVVRVIGKIVFASDRDGDFEIYVMDTDGGGQTRLTETSGEDYYPAWSPDGSKLAFVSTRDGNAEIYVMNADGTGQTRLTNETASDLAPVWTRDGSQIGFVTNRDGNDEIYLMNADGSNQTNLTSHPADDSSFSFSPNGLMIAFSSNREGSQFEIFTMGSAGGNVARLTNSVGDDVSPSWSSQRIAFESNRDENEELYSVTIDGQNQIRLTNNTEIDIDPSQLGDGSRIAFSTSRDTNLEIYLMNADGTGLTRLTTNNAADVQPAIQPNGIVFPPAPPGAAVVQFSSIDFSAGEASGFTNLSVVRSGDTSGTSTIDVVTGNGTATNRSDYTFRFATLKFNPGETTKNLPVIIADDVLIETDETLAVTLSNPTGAFVGALNTTTLTIVDNDTSRLAANPIDNARFFANQHYSDFLSRVPDQAGLDFWTNEITSCGSNLPCLEVRRINVSAAFFLSIEFQETGFLAYRIHKSAFGNLPGAPVPIRLEDLLPDTQQIGAGLIVGQAGWEQVLENNKQAFVADFVLRARFVAAFPTTMSPAQFVDALFANAGVVPSAAERAAAINEFGGAASTVDNAARARALRRVGENPTLRQQEFNRAFVLMQYFGYLRRNPNDLPDSNFDGFNFWLNKLNQFNGNFVQAEMVKAFILSLEFRKRFGR